MSTTLPKHGPLNCDICWQNCQGSERRMGHDKFKIIQDPGSWGSDQPEILVLGISKGNTQAKAMQEDEFDQVAFKHFRHRLFQALKAIGLKDVFRPQDTYFTRSEKVFSWGSVIRCSLTAKNKDNTWTAESGPVLKAFLNTETKEVIQNCVNQWLSELSDSLKLVIFLGNSQAYLKHMSSIMRQKFDDYKQINNVSFRADGRLWIFVAHPSPANGHFGAFLKGKQDNPAGQKMPLVREALQKHTPDLINRNISAKK